MFIRFTVKQLQIMKAIKDKRPDGDFCDVYDIMDSLPYTVKRDALLHSIRILVEAGYVQRLPNVKRGPARSVRPFTLTKTGESVV